MHLAKLVLWTFAVVLLLSAMTFCRIAACQQRVKEPGETKGIDGDSELLPAGAIARLGTRRWRNVGSQLAFSPDGRHLATAGWTRLIDPATGKVVRWFDTVSSQALFLPDNKTVILASRNGPGLHWLDVETGRVIRHIPNEGHRTTWYSWSSDGKTMACYILDYEAKSWNIAVWDLGAGTETWKSVTTGKDIPQEIALAPDGKILAVRTFSQIRLLDAADGKELRRWDSKFAVAGDTGYNKKIVFSPDGKILASAPGGQRVILWDPVTGEPLSKCDLAPFLLTGKDNPATLAFSADGRYLAAGCHAGTVFLWDLQDHKMMHSLAASTGMPVYDVVFKPDGKTLITIAHESPLARLWDVSSGKEISTLPNAAGKGSDMAFSPNGKSIATVAIGESPCLWDTVSGKLLRRYSDQLGGSLTFLRGGKTLAAQGLNHMAIWNIETGKSVYHWKPSAQLAIVPDEDSRVSIFSNCCLDEHTMIAVFGGEEKPVVQAQQGPLPIPQGPLPAPRRVHWTMIGLWDVHTEQVKRAFRVEAENVARLFLSPDRQTVIGIGTMGPEHNGFLFGWDVETGRERFRIPAPTWCEGIQVSPDGRSMLISARHPIAGDYKFVFSLIEVASNCNRAEVEYKVGDGFNTLSAVANERLAAVVRKETIYLINPLTGLERRRLVNDKFWVSNLAFSPDGRYLASGSDDTSVLVWDTADLAKPEPFDRSTVSDKDLMADWAGLAGPDAAAAYRAIGRLSASPKQTIALFADRLQPVPTLPAKALSRLAALLDSLRFAERDHATAELLRLGELAEPILTQTVKRPPSLEAKLRAENILNKLRLQRGKAPTPLSGDLLREVRAVEILEKIGTDEAKGLLARLASGAPHAVLTREARASVRRLCGPD